MDKNISLQTWEASVFGCSTVDDDESRSISTSSLSADKEAGVASCRVCHCSESDKRGSAALAFLGINPPANDARNGVLGTKSDGRVVLEDIETDSYRADRLKRSGIVEFISPNGEIFVCSSDVGVAPGNNEDELMELGCACKNDLSLVHYACALKWFVQNGSTVCEICGCVAENVKTVDVRKVVKSLKDYEALRERTANGEPAFTQVLEDSGVDPDALAAIRRQRLSEISLWFKPLDNSVTMISHAVSPLPPTSHTEAEETAPNENSATRWSMVGSGIMLAAGLLTVILAWLIAPRVGKRTAKIVLHILLAGVCALAVAITFRFFVLRRMKYGRARYWAILFFFWFLVFGIWASGTHHARVT